MSTSLEPGDHQTNLLPNSTGTAASFRGQSLRASTVLFLLCSLSMITYVDRVCFGAAAPLIADDLGLPNVSALKGAFTAFSIAYAIFEFPAGWLGDRLGPKSILIRIVLWWSACTALTGMVGMEFGGWTFGGLWLMVIVRFLFGAGEAGAYPNITRAIHNWFPRNQWELAQGKIWMSGRIAGGITPLIWTVLVSGTAVSGALMSWRGAFITFGVIGVLWCIVFRWKFQNSPPSTTETADGSLPHTPEKSEQLAVVSDHANVRWGELLTDPSLWALCTLYFFVNYGWVFNITYLPSYLHDRFGIDDTDLVGAIYKGAPLWVGAIGCFLGGHLVNLLEGRVGDRRRARTVLGFSAMLTCALCWWIARETTSIHLFCIGVSLAAFCVDLTLGAAWASCQEIGSQSPAAAAAIMNTVGTLGAAAAAWFTGSIVEGYLVRAAAAHSTSLNELATGIKSAATLDGFQAVFASYALVYLLAALLWWTIRPRPIS